VGAITPTVPPVFASDLPFSGGLLAVVVLVTEVVARQERLVPVIPE
jgi:hypothetical protein